MGSRRRDTKAELPSQPAGSNLRAASSIGEWCNGSTTGSEPVSLGSNPSSPVLIPHAPGGLRWQARWIVASSLTRRGLARHARHHLACGPLERISLGKGVGVERAIAALANRPDVLDAEPYWILHAAALSNDPGYVSGQLWGMHGDDLGISVGPSGTTNAFGSQAEKAWDAGFTGAKSVAVGIGDSNDAVANYPSNYSTLPSGSYGTSSAATRRAGISRSAALPRRPAADRPRYSPQGCSFSAEKNAA